MRMEQLTHHYDLKFSLLKIFGLSINILPDFPPSDACAIQYLFSVPCWRGPN